MSKSAFLDVALKQGTNAVDLTIAQKETGGENPGGENPGGENPGGENPGGETRAVRILAVKTRAAASRAFSRPWPKAATSGIPPVRSPR